MAVVGLVAWIPGFGPWLKTIDMHAFRLGAVSSGPGGDAGDVLGRRWAESRSFVQGDSEASGVSESSIVRHTPNQSNQNLDT